MIRTVITPEHKEILITIPLKYVGKPLEILIFSNEELDLSNPELPSPDGTINSESTPSDTTFNTAQYENHHTPINDIKEPKTPEHNPTLFPFWNLHKDNPENNDEDKNITFIERESDI